MRNSNAAQRRVFDDDSDIELLLGHTESALPPSTEDPNNKDPQGPCSSRHSSSSSPTLSFAQAPRMLLDDDDDFSFCQSLIDTNNNNYRNLEDSPRSSTAPSISESDDTVLLLTTPNNSNNNNTGKIITNNNNKNGTSTTTPTPPSSNPARPKETIYHVFCECPAVAQLRAKYEIDPVNPRRTLKVLLSTQRGYDFFTEVLKLVNVEPQLRQPKWMEEAFDDVADPSNCDEGNTDLQNPYVLETNAKKELANYQQQKPTSNTSGFFQAMNDPPSQTCSSTSDPNHTIDSKRNTVVSSGVGNGRRQREEEEEVRLVSGGDTAQQVDV